MSKYVFIKTLNNSAYMNTADNFRGAIHSADTAVDLYFNAAGSTVSGAYDKIPLVITTQKEQEVMDAIGGALAGTHSKGMIVIADDVATSYVNQNITSVGTFSLAQTGVLYRKAMEDVTADDTLTVEESGTTFIWQDAAAVLTLPDSGGGDIIGVHYHFISNFAGTGQEVKCADTGNEIMIGNVLGSDTGDDTTIGSFNAEVGDAFSSIEFTGATEGELGSNFTLTCYDTDRWLVQGTVLHDGSIATPFATS